MTVIEIATTEMGIDHDENVDIEVELDLVTSAKRPVATGVVILEFQRADGADLPPWSAGAHVELLLEDGLARQYSLCSDPSDRATWAVAVLREPESRGGSSYIHDTLRPGTVVKARGPRNNFTLTPAKSYKFVAGGIGITPMLPMIRAAERAGAQWTLLYGGRALDSMAFRDELAGYGDRVTFHPQDTHGHLDLAGELADPADGAQVYCCGPEPLLDAIEQLCGSSWPDGALHVERFRNEAPDLEGARPIEVELAQSGQTLTVPADRSVLEVLVDNGIDIDASCEEGTCGTCEVEVLEGQPEHHDVVLTKSEKESCEMMMVCVSRAKGKCLKLDL